jgi:adenylate cyclase
MMKPFGNIGRRDLRLGSGLVLFTYLTVHLVNHALGLISFKVAEEALHLVVAFWHSAPGTVLLYGAAATHVALALLAVYERRTLCMPALQALRTVLGLWMPVVLITHFTGSRLAFEQYNLPSDYARIVPALWTPTAEGRQLALLVPGWIHGCLGLKFAFGGKKWYGRAMPLLFGASLLLPVLAGLGFLAMGRELAHAQAVLPQALAVSKTEAQQLQLGLVRDSLLAGYCAIIALALMARHLRWIVERQQKALVTIAYPGQTVQVPRDWTVLEASRSFGIPHLSVCGGNARCSTCRVRVDAGADRCPPPSVAEQQLLSRMGADTDVRLACQLRPHGDISVVPLFAAASAAWSRIEDPPKWTEQTAVILVADLCRSGASTSSHRSAHETLKAMGLIEDAVHKLNARLATDIGALGELVLAAHTGSVVLGQMGHREARALSAVGPAVDVARRLRDQPLRVCTGGSLHACLSEPLAF